MSNKYKYQNYITKLNHVIKLMTSNEIKKKDGKKLIHFPLEKMQKMQNIQYDAEGNIILSVDNDTITITKDDIICTRKEDKSMNRKPKYLLTKMDSGHNEQSCFIVNEGVTMENHKDKVKDQILAMINDLKRHKNFNNDVIHEYNVIKNILGENNFGAERFKNVYAINIRPYNTGSFSFIKKEHNGQIDIKIANCYIIALGKDKQISILSNYDRDFNYYNINNEFYKIDEAVDLFNKNNTINIKNIFNIIRNYRFGTLNSPQIFITPDGMIGYEKVSEIDQKRIPSVFDQSEYFGEQRLDIDGKTVSLSESYQGSMKAPSYINI